MYKGRRLSNITNRFLMCAAVLSSGAYRLPEWWDVDEAPSSVVLYVVSSTEQNFPSVPSSHRCPENGDLPARYAQTVEYLSSRWRTGLTAELFGQSSCHNSVSS